jgi:S1-C subfamily serine protease
MMFKGHKETSGVRRRQGRLGPSTPPARKRGGRAHLPFAGLFVLVVLDQIPAADVADFPTKVHDNAVVATVQIRALPQMAEGSGALIGKSGPFVYILTAQHLVKRAEGFEITVFLKDSDPKPKTVYRSAKVIAEMEGLADLALIRLTSTDDMPGFVRVCPETKVQNLPGKVLALGCEAGKGPAGLLENVARKKLARRDDGNELVSFWEVDHKHARGRSGGPLVDQRGYLVGVCSGSNREKSYFTHVVEIHGFLKRNGFRWLLEEEDSKPKAQKNNYP